MLDTNIVSDLLRNPQGRAAVKLRQHGSSTSCLSIITAAELRCGAVKRRSPQLMLRVDTLLTKIAVLPFDTPCDAAYGRLRAGLEAVGEPIGPLDPLIAAYALELQITLITNNTGEFRRVPGLLVEDWLA